MLPLNQQRRESQLLHAIADSIEGFSREFRADATKGTEIDELVGEAKALILDAAARSPLMGLPAAEQTKLAESLKLRKR